MTLSPIAIRARSAVTGFGDTAAAHVEALKAGRTGLKATETSRGLGPLHAASMEAGLDAGERRPYVLIDTAVKALGLSKHELKESALFTGTTTGISASEEIVYLRDKAAGLPWQAAFTCGGQGRTSAYAASAFGIEGPCFTYTTACTSTAVAAVMAARMLRQGRIRRAVVIGIDVLMKMSLEGFRLLQLYSEAGCRPFDARRDGLMLGEACAAFVLEKGDGPVQLLDGAIHHDPGHIAAGSTDGITAAAVMADALKRSGVRPGEVAAVKAHGTGTPTNDLTELNALSVAFDGKPPPFSSLKSTFGHTLGASAALELVTWSWCAEAGFVPGTHGFQQRIAESKLVPLIEPTPLGNRRGVHLFNAFGFGGTSVSFAVEVRR
ncbi:MAG: hypothetical protein JNK82_36985 [Myxococcaceae bacterium]|nr:hypothetical protein [Myxococcaceae bacterium]